ncbi:MAG: hypothetical protein WDO14_08625 [Bacteroidota bacterium]
MSSCFDQGDCVFTNSNVVRFDFVNIRKPSTLIPVVVDSIITPLDDATILYKDSVVTASATYLVSLDPTKNETEFIFYWGNRVDTLVLTYTYQSKVLGPDCGTLPFYNDLSIKYNTFNTVLIPNPEVRVNFATKLPNQNVQILL